MAVPSSFPPFDGVLETVNGEINVYEILANGFNYQITDLDRLEKLTNGEFQIAEHKSSQKLSLLEPARLNEVTKLFFSEDPATLHLHLKPSVNGFEVYDAIEDRLSAKERQKKARGKLTKLDRARKKYVLSLVNKAKAISYVSKERKLGKPTVELDVNPLGKYTGPTTEGDPDTLKSTITNDQVIVFRCVDERWNQSIPLSEHTAKNMQLLIALAQSEIDETYGTLGIKVKFERQIKQ